MRILITGAGGFLGTHLVNFLKKIPEVDFEFFSLGLNENENCEHLFLDDINNKNLINKHISRIRPNYLFHLAGTSNNQENIIQNSLVNTDFARFMLESIENNNLQDYIKILITGSAAEYGVVSLSDLPISEEQTPKPVSTYGKTKYAQTIHATKWQQNRKKLVIVRPFNIIGQNMPKHLALGSFIDQIESISKKGNIKTGNLNAKRDFIDVSDVVNLMWKLVNNENAFGEIINICTGIGTPISDILDKIIDLSGKEINIVNEKTRLKENDVSIHFGCNKKLLKIIGEYNFISWEEAINTVMSN